MDAIDRRIFRMETYPIPKRNWVWKYL